jgi:ketol-acid reductoisomerase
MENYFNTLNFRQQAKALNTCEFLDDANFSNGIEVLKGKKVVIIGCGAQGLNQGLNMRDSGLDISYALRKDAIEQNRISYQNAVNNGFNVGTMEELLPTADLVLNLTPDKQHTPVLNDAVPLMKKNAVLSYSHGFNIVEEGMKIREDITVIMVAPKCPGTEVREEYKRGFGVPTLIAVHEENDPHGIGFDWAKAYAYATGGHRAGVLRSSFVAEVKSDLMGEQTILCGVLQTASILCFDKLIELGEDASKASKLIQYGWEELTDALKEGGISLLMNRLGLSARVKANDLASELKEIMKPLFQKHMDDILSGAFSSRMMEDWKNGDTELLTWRAETAETAFEKSTASSETWDSQYYFDHGLVLVSFLKAGVELAYETMVEAGIAEESAYYESLHEAPLIANTIARKKLFEMNRIISDTAEYGCYLFDHACKPLLNNFIKKVDSTVLGGRFEAESSPSNANLNVLQDSISEHSIEKIGKVLRAAMKKNDK